MKKGSDPTILLISLDMEENLNAPVSHSQYFSGAGSVQFAHVYHYDAHGHAVYAYADGAFFGPASSCLWTVEFGIETNVTIPAGLFEDKKKPPEVEAKLFNYVHSPPPLPVEAYYEVLTSKIPGPTIKGFRMNNPWGTNYTSLLIVASFKEGSNWLPLRWDPPLIGPRVLAGLSDRQGRVLFPLGRWQYVVTLTAE